ncbi:MAG: glycerophosphodiester phosphodiesterase [Solirubrobacterales bacterium]|nr:glycerophosphodiester phosphodiesterase [Solirubrobacterales bacterium]
MSSSCLVIAHRGAWGSASPAAAAQNTLEAFEAAMALGVDMIECDVRRTRDGQLVVFHDARVKTMPTRSLRYDALKVKGTTSRPPLLADVVALTKGKIALNVELKEPGYVDETIALLRPFGLDHCLLSSFFDDVLREAKALAPELRTGLLIAAGFRKAFTIRLHAAHADCLGLHRRLASATALASAAAAGIPCVIWTVNAPQAMDRYLAHTAVEGIVTDRPALALERRALLHPA